MSGWKPALKAMCGFRLRCLTRLVVQRRKRQVGFKNDYAGVLLLWPVSPRHEEAGYAIAVDNIGFAGDFVDVIETTLYFRSYDQRDCGSDVYRLGD